MEKIKKKITLKQIGDELGFSISTVSKALKDSDEIGSETKKTIKALAKFYNYRPNSTALNLRNGCTKNIGVIFPSINHGFFSASFSGIEKFAAGGILYPFFAASILLTNNANFKLWDLNRAINAILNNEPFNIPTQ